VNKFLFCFVLLVCPLFGTACAVTNINDCDEAVAFYNQLLTDDAKENLKPELLPAVMSDATEGSEGTLYRDDHQDIRLIELIHYGGSGKQIVNYTILDQRNYRVDITRVVYDKPIGAAQNPVAKDRLYTRIDICDGVGVDVVTDRPESSDLKTYPLSDLLQSLSKDE